MASLATRASQSVRWLRRMLALWRHPNRRFLTFPPGHFASPLPDHNAIERDYSRSVSGDVNGIDFDVGEQLELLATIAPQAKSIAFPEQPADGFRYHFENDFLTYGDALVLAGMMRHLRPRRIVEIGSGFSSALMLDTRDRAGLATRLTFVEPHPARLNTLLRQEDRASFTVIEKPVQELPLDFFRELEANDILFIDSSHVAKIGSDVNRLFFDVLPILRPGVRVQVHDIFWPFEYPKAWYDRGWAWNETYVVRALLLGGRRYRVELFASQLEALRVDAIRRVLPEALRRAAATPETGMSSLWLRIE